MQNAGQQQRAATSQREVSLRSLATFIIYISLCPPLSPDSVPFTSLCSRAILQPPCQGDQLLCRKGTGIVMSALNSAEGEYTNSSPLLNSHPALEEELKRNRG